MHQRTLIKKTVSLVLLLIFAFSITPKQWIHKIVFKHKDVYALCADGSTKTHLHQSGFHCELDNLVLLSPFTSDVNIIEPAASPIVHSIYFTYSTKDYSFAACFYSDLRGPPAIS